MIKTAYTFS